MGDLTWTQLQVQLLTKVRRSLARVRCVRVGQRPSGTSVGAGSAVQPGSTTCRGGMESLEDQEFDYGCQALKCQLSLLAQSQST